MVFTVFHGVSLSSVTLRNTEHFATCSLMGLHGFSIVLPYHHKKCWEKQKWVVLVLPFLVCFLLEVHIRSLFQPSIGQRLYTLAEHYCVQEGNIDKAVLNQRPRFFFSGMFQVCSNPIKSPRSALICSIFPLQFLEWMSLNLLHSKNRWSHFEMERHTEISFPSGNSTARENLNGSEVTHRTKWWIFINS